MDNGKNAIEKRSMLMHPKTAMQMDISTNEWQEHYEGISWLIYASSSLIEKAYQKYGT